MCGIAAFNGRGNATAFVVDAIRKLEYRGYDSWGLGTQEGILRGLGPLSYMEGEQLKKNSSELAIGHTRWATHGKVSLENAHPISGGARWQDGFGKSCSSAYVVHNGIIDNYKELKRQLEAEDYVFESETDTEVIAHLLAMYAPDRRPEEVLKFVTNKLSGQYAFAAICTEFPNTLLLACNGSPLLITSMGHVASDPYAFRGYAEKCFVMEDGQMAVMRQDNEGCCEITVFNDKVDDLWQAMALGMISVPDSGEDGRGSQPHFMLKEILEQEKVITGKRFWIQRGYLIRPQEIIILGCGSSYNAALLGRKFIEDYAGIRTSVEYASEFTSRRIGLYASDALFITISQSGETKDVLEAVKHIKTAYTADRILAITNTEHSKLARESGHLLLLNAGLEQGVAATKTFTATIAALVETASRFTYDRMFPRKREAMLSKELPAAIAEVTAPSFKKRIKELADSLSDFENVLFLGRGLHYPTAREAALKLKEVAYVHAEAMPAAEMKHGPIALIDDKTLSVFIVTDTGGGLEKILANVEEIRSRNGQVLVIGDDDFQKGHYLTIPKVDPLIQPILVSVVLQLFAYYVAVKRGCNVDKPRSLAKCVTV